MKVTKINETTYKLYNPDYYRWITTKDYRYKYIFCYRFKDDYYVERMDGELLCYFPG